MPTAGKEQNQLVDCRIRRFLQALACPNYAQLEPPAAAFGASLRCLANFDVGKPPTTQRQTQQGGEMSCREFPAERSNVLANP